MQALLTVKGDRIELEPGHDYVLGRSRTCDVVAEDALCSRRHARLTVGATAQETFVVDLKSRNGTFVNEEAIEGRARIENGNRIRIGGTIYLFSTEDATEEEPADLDETGTLAFDVSPPEGPDHDKLMGLVRSLGALGSEFAGQISRYNLIDILQVLMRTTRSGTLHVVTEGDPAEIDVRCGEVYGARYAALVDFDALVALARQTTGIFWLEADASPCNRTLEQPFANLLIDLCRALDEAAEVDA